MFNRSGYRVPIPQAIFLNSFIGKVSLNFFFCFIPVFFFSCTERNSRNQALSQRDTAASGGPMLVVLGNVQDGGSPHIGCKKECCRELFLHPDPERKVVSLGVVDPQNKKCFIFEATPDFTTQVKELKNLCPYDAGEIPDGIFLTHAHIGHYTGLMFLGREAINAKEAKVYAMPKMYKFLRENGPWSQLVQLRNIDLQELSDSNAVQVTSHIRVTPFTVPHRDEYSETVGYLIEGPDKKVLFIPDIDKWEKWNRDIVEMIAKVDYAFIDGTFYDGAEINNRNIAEIPHPFVIESMEKFKTLSAEEKKKIFFIHFNHTNPILRVESEVSARVKGAGFGIARKGMQIKL
jgi:pyrroloquinoline quinone biosynthesis protein B